MCGVWTLNTGNKSHTVKMARAYSQACRHIQVQALNPFNPEFTIVIFIHYKPRIAAAILDL